MMDGLANWMEHNPRVIVAMGIPIFLFLGQGFLQNGASRIACTVTAVCTMIAVTVMAVLTARWNDLLWPCMGFIAWSAINGVRKAVA